MISLREAVIIGLSTDIIIKLKELGFLQTSLEELDLQLLSLTDDELIERFEIEIEGVTRLYYIYYCLDSDDMNSYLHKVDIDNFVSIIKSKHKKDEDQLSIIAYQRIIKNNDELEVVLDAFDQDMREWCIQLLFKRGKEEKLFKRLMKYIDSKNLDGWSNDFIFMITIITLSMKLIPIEWIYKLNNNDQLGLIYEAKSHEAVKRIIDHFGLDVDDEIFNIEYTFFPTVVLSLAKKGMSLDRILPKVGANKKRYVLGVYNNQV